ncbi:hypothetical protein MAR_014802 [Mya arenaria]|uniref:PGG domain-containing protein n=1 Tax=Mya arenaria TaxID=6604 RepID=A0ABY7FJG5_MYAAR|nr:hypothetical protein MAR_014802 [Mya arenaria]
MCTTNKNGKKSSKIRKRVLGENGMTESQDYYQLHQDNVDSERSKDNVEGRTLEKLVYVAATLGILVLTLVVSSQQWAMPFPEHENLYRAVFAVANGPVLVAAAVYRNSLVARWFPAQTSLFWCRTFAAEVPPFSPVWMYAVPFVFFLLHSCVDYSTSSV